MANDYNAEMNFFDEEDLAKDWLNRLCRRVSWKIFENQEDICYMVNELGEGRNPKLKDNAIDVIQQLVIQELDLEIGDITMYFVRSLIDNDIDCSPEVAVEVNDWFGLDEEEEYEGRED